MAADGSDIIRLSHHETHEWHPSVTNDGMIVGCAALYPYGTGQAELACLAVNPDFRRYGYGERLMRRIASRGKASGVRELFVLTTQATHWFIERGFVVADVERLPDEKQLVYNFQRRSKVLIITL